MILIFLAIFSTIHADHGQQWQRQCEACHKKDITCEMMEVASRQVAEIRLNKTVPESASWLTGCDGVDVLHIDFNLNPIDSKLILGEAKVDTLILSNVSSIGQSAFISRDNANSVIFCNLSELGTYIPDVGRLAFTGAFDSSVLSLFPKGQLPAKDTMSIVFTPSFNMIIDSPMKSLPSHVRSLLLRVASADRFLHVTESILSLKHKPVINVILDTNDDEEDYLATPEFFQRMAQLASAIEIRKQGMVSEGFTKDSLPRHLLVNLIRVMFITYHQIRNRPGSSALAIFFQADHILKTKIHQLPGVHCQPHKEGFRCRLNIKQLFETCDNEDLRSEGNEYGSFVHSKTSSLREILTPRKEEALSNQNGAPSTQKSLTTNLDGVLDEPGNNSQQDVKTKTSSRSKNSIDEGTDSPRAKADTMNENASEPAFEESSESTASSPSSPEDQPNIPGTSNTSACVDVEGQPSCNDSPDMQHKDQAANPHAMQELDTKDHPASSSEQVTALSEMELPQQKVTDISDHSKGSTLDSPVVMICIVAGSVIVLTIALIVIFVTSKRRRLKQSAKSQSPANSKNETDPETLWW